MTPFLLLTATTTTTALDPPALAALAALAVLGWRLLTVWLFPFAPCRHCRGSGKHRSARYWRPCRKCKGTGRRIRTGRRIWDWTRSTDTARKGRGPS